MTKRKGAKRNAVPKPLRKSKSSKSLKEPVDYNRVLFLSSVIAFLAIVFLLVAFNSNHEFTGNVITGNPSKVVPSQDGSGSTATITTGDWQSAGVESPAVAGILLYVFGKPVQFPGFSTQTSAIIVTIAVWLLLFFTFGDIISTFGAFSKWVAWIAGGLMTLILANIGLVVKIAVIMTGIFGFLGTAAVYAGIGTAFVAFIFLNVIVAGPVHKWMMARRTNVSAYRALSGGKRLAGGIKGFSEIEKALEEGAGNK